MKRERQAPRSHRCSDLQLGHLCVLIASMASSAPTKKPRLSDFGRSSHVTASALSRLLQEVRDRGLPDSCSRSSIQRDRQRILNEPTPFGSLLSSVTTRTTKGEDLVIPIQNPYAMLHVALMRSPALNRYLLSGLQDTSTLQLVFYADEVTPGDPLVVCNRRKVQVIYWSCLNLGVEALAREEAWFELLTLRSTLVRDLDGGMSQVFRSVLKAFFGRPHGHDLRNGLKIEVGGEAKLLFGKIALLVGDEKSLKELSMAKGAGGLKMCICCSNIVDHKHKLGSDPTNFLLPSTSLHVRSFHLNTDATIRGIYKRLHAAHNTMNKGEFIALQKHLGFSYSPECVLMDDDLDIKLISILMWDWMHALFQKGAVNIEVAMFFDRLQKCSDLTTSSFHAYLSSWCWPKEYASAKHVFAPSQASSSMQAGFIKGSASEVLSMIPVLLKFITDVVEPLRTCEQETKSCKLLCEVVGLLTVVNQGSCSPSRLEHALLAHAEAYQGAYGVVGWIPKMHHILHLPRQLEVHSVLISCFLHERKHRTVKRMAQPRVNTTSFDQGLLADCTLQHLYELSSWEANVGLKEPRQATDTILETITSLMDVGENDDVLTSRVAYVRVRACATGDAVLFYKNGSLAAGEIIFHASVGGSLVSAICEWPVIAQGEISLKCMVKRGSVSLVATATIVESCVHSSAVEGQLVTVIVHWSLRL